MKRIERLLRAIDRFQQRHSVLGLPFGVLKKYGDDQGGKKAALLAHYGFLSLFPLALVFLTVLGYTLANNPELKQGVIDTLARQFPVLGPQVEKSISAIKGSGVALGIGLLGILWGGLGIVQSFQDAMNDLWNVPRRVRPNFWWRLARGLAALLLVAGELVAATVLAQLGIAGPGLLGRVDLLGGSFLLNLLLLLLMFQVLTGTRLRWRWLLPG
ncbi:MAG TPA: YhjD/YihY/BrkB family envelope integrity protein, partial [Actinomycetes bacterium]